LDCVAETERLRLRRLLAADAAFILQLLNQPGWLEFIGDRNVRSPAQAGDYLAQRIDAQFERYGYGMWGVELHAEVRPGQPLMGQPMMGQTIGLVGLVKRDYLPEPDLGFALLDGYAGRGLAYEAARAVLSLARERGLKRLLAITDPDNGRSIALLDRLGFELEGPQAVPGGTKSVQRYSRALDAHER
jgi:ribosomal-protein-alanine N-acetyltransferase